MNGRSLSLKFRLALGAAVLGAAAIATALILYIAMNRVSDGLEAVLASEARTARFSQLSTQASTFIVVSAEAIHSGLPAQSREQRIEPIADQIRDTFEGLRGAVELAVGDVATLGINAQSRFGTQSLGLARMEAILNSTVAGLGSDTDDRERLQAHLDGFATAFDPLLSEAVNVELMFRNQTLASIDRLRGTLSAIAIVIAVGSVLLVAAFYLGLIHPQFRRLDRLREAARRIANEDFGVTLPDNRGDEIGQLYTETNRMAAALAERHRAVEARWSQLNEIIDQRTEELRAANIRLAQIDENRRRFFADISHELRTPLTVIIAEAQIGRAGMPGVQAACETIEARAVRLSRRIDDLLRVARSETGQLALDPVSADLAEIALAAVDETRSESSNTRIRIATEFDGPLPVHCDRNWIRQVIAEIIRNAIRHASETETIVVTGSRLTNGAAEVAVEDLGPGIDPAVQAKIFERFAQGEGDKPKGFGLGLALAHWVVTEQGGEIFVQSPVSDDRGTRVHVRLPQQTG